MSKKTIKKVKDYLVCVRCGINSWDDKNRMMPCPRGGCEAEEAGKITTTTKLTLFKNKK